MSYGIDVSDLGHRVADLAFRLGMVNKTFKNSDVLVELNRLAKLQGTDDQASSRLPIAVADK